MALKTYVNSSVNSSVPLIDLLGLGFILRSQAMTGTCKIQ